MYGFHTSPDSKAAKQMEEEHDDINGGGAGGVGEWRFAPNKVLMTASSLSVRGVLSKITANIEEEERRPRIPLGHGDPSVFSCFRTDPVAEDAVVSALRSARFNCYAPCVGLAPARSAIADYLSRDLPYKLKLSPNSVYLTNGCAQAIEIISSVLARPGANFLLPRPGYLFYEARAAFNGIEVRYFDLLPQKCWELDLDGVEALADENTVAMVIINPGNPCGNVFTYQHFAQVAATAKKLGMMIISDEVYGHLTFGSNPFVPMGVFGPMVPVLTLGSISKRWVVPGWRLGWIVINDPNGVLKDKKIVECLENYLDISTDPATFIQAAIPQIIQNTKEEYFEKTVDLLRQTADICYSKLEEISCITCPNKPEGSMFVMVKLHLSQLEDIYDDFDFCCKLAKEELVIILPGCAVGFKNWLRITFAVGPSSLEDGLSRVKSFCLRHARKENK